MKYLLEKWMKGEHASENEAFDFMSAVSDGKVTAETAAGCLVALNVKGETPEEISGFVKSLREKCLRVNAGAHDFIDVCGTGGDGVGTFNVSTAAAFVVAACGVGVAKHGNRSVSSRSGSSDVLEALGVKAVHDETSALRALEKFGLAFLHAPSFHPALKNVATLRKNLGVKTVFNILGPMLNPVFVSKQMIGVFKEDLLKKVAKTCQALGSREIVVVHGGGGLDEFSLAGTSRFARLSSGEISFHTAGPQDFKLQAAPMNELRGGDSSENARMIENIFAGETGPKRDVVVMNAAAALVVGGKAKTLPEGTILASRCLDEGKAKDLLAALREA